MQVNTGAAAVLYALVGAWAAPDTGAVLLDVCCGTGTIGLTLARRVSACMVNVFGQCHGRCYCRALHWSAAISHTLATSA